MEKPPSLFQTRLFQDAVFSTQGQIIARFARYSDTPQLGGMFELPVTSHSGDKIPVICFQQFEHVADLHKGKLSCPFEKLGAAQSDIHLPHRQINANRRMRPPNLRQGGDAVLPLVLGAGMAEFA